MRLTTRTKQLLQHLEQGHIMRLCDIALYLNTKPSNANGTMKRLEKVGLVKAFKTPSSTHYAITEEGRQLVMRDFTMPPSAS
ncbi:winged helix DNA-binding protein [Vibrio mediterranei]|uniref:winged helix DNA-binding protein n=1 Tax=Vibrio mediterranei TaxID=689 RepID=UPI001EFEB113|nr:winged helix DNA-binding protein [Vibrio mediterranei]MCG9628500.1 winged helix DNA-binding protein [Vibrio mediterranei]